MSRKTIARIFIISFKKTTQSTDVQLPTPGAFLMELKILIPAQLPLSVNSRCARALSPSSGFEHQGHVSTTAAAGTVVVWHRTGCFSPVHQNTPASEAI